MKDNIVPVVMEPPVLCVTGRVGERYRLPFYELKLPTPSSPKPEPITLLIHTGADPDIHRVRHTIVDPACQLQFNCVVLVQIPFRSRTRKNALPSGFRNSKGPKHLCMGHLS
jgi:hypothetical protein